MATIREMRIIVLAILNSLDERQRKKINFRFEDRERFCWYYTPTDHGGLSLEEMNPEQHRLVHKLLSFGLSHSGYNTVGLILGLENILDRLENFAVDFGRMRGRDPNLYYLAIFGDPSKKGHWSWRFGGHHISIQYVLNEDTVISYSPFFMGADPADSNLLGKNMHRPLADTEDMGRELFNSLGALKEEAMISTIAPVDIVTGNRAIIKEGDEPMHLVDLWRGDFGKHNAKVLNKIQKITEKKLTLESKNSDQLKFTFKPKGLAFQRMNKSQRLLFWDLIKLYASRLPSNLAKKQLSLVEHEIEDLTFAWAGSIQKYQPHYYRIQGKRVLIEYDNSQRDANHIHTVWRDLKYDFGGDPLKEHYENNQHHPHQSRN